MQNPNEEDFYSDSEHHEDHIDEKWLISYSDMMTLLFGFFVMMYVLSTTNKAKMEETLRKISKEGFNTDTAASALKTPSNHIEKSHAPAEDVLIELKKRIEEKAKKEMEESLIQVKQEQIKNEQELKEALEKINKLQDIQIVADTEKEKLETKIKDMERIISEHEQSLDKNKVKDLDQIKNLKRSIASLTNSLKISEDKNNDIIKQNLALKKQVDEGPKINDDDHFMMVFIKWETEKHDIDMIVEDPKGNIFNYKKRTLANVPGEFVVDSTQGPGVESWVTNKTMEGIYKVTFRFYNQYGNKKDAIIRPSIFNNLKVVNLPAITLNFAQKREKTISIKVANNGQFAVIP